MKHRIHVVLLTLYLISTSLADAASSLPKEFRKGKTAAKVTMLEFSAPWCASCKKLKPELTKLQKKFGANLVVHHINLESEAGEKQAESFGVDSIPTFFLYNKQYQLIQKIEKDITPEQLRSLITQAEK